MTDRRCRADRRAPARKPQENRKDRDSGWVRSGRRARCTDDAADLVRLRDQGLRLGLELARREVGDAGQQPGRREPGTGSSLTAWARSRADASRSLAAVRFSVAACSVALAHLAVEVGQVLGRADLRRLDGLAVLVDDDRRRGHDRRGGRSGLDHGGRRDDGSGRDDGRGLGDDDLRHDDLGGLDLGSDDLGSGLRDGGGLVGERGGGEGDGAERGRHRSWPASPRTAERADAS